MSEASASPASQATPPVPGNAPPPARDFVGSVRAACPYFAIPFFIYLYVLFIALRFEDDHGLYERDGFFHARYAQMMPERGLSREFAWTQLSVWKDRFCDDYFLYHVLMAPFARDETDPLRGVRWFAAGLSTAVFVAFYLLLRAQGVPGPLWFTLLLAGIGGPFLSRMLMVRPHVWSVILILVGFGLIYARRYRLLAALGFVYAWSYSVPWLLPAVATVYALGAWLGRGELDWRAPLFAAAGVCLGLLVHPYSPLTVSETWSYFGAMYWGLQGRSGLVRPGAELSAFSTRDFLFAFPLLSPLVWAWGLAGWRARPAISPQAFGTMLAGVVWYALAFVYNRSVEYAAPFVCLGCALTVRDLLHESDWPRACWAHATPRRRLAYAALLIWGALLLVAFHAYAAKQMYTLERHPVASPPLRYREAAAFLRQETMPGETIVNLTWGDFPDLFYCLPDRHYVWALDPTFSHRQDPETTEKLERMRRHPEAADAEWLARTFHARYLVARRELADVIVAAQPPPLRLAYRDSRCAVFELIKDTTPPQAP